MRNERKREVLIEIFVIQFIHYFLNEESELPFFIKKIIKKNEKIKNSYGNKNELKIQAQQIKMSLNNRE